MVEQPVIIEDDLFFLIPLNNEDFIDVEELEAATLETKYHLQVEQAHSLC